MGELFSSRLHFLGLKLETTPGTALTFGASDYNLLAENIKFTINWKENQRKYTVGSPDAFPSQMGARDANISFSMHAQGSGVAGTAPVWFAPMQAGGFRKISSSFGSMLVKELTGQTCTIGYVLKEDTSINPRGKAYTAKGCAADKITLHYANSGELLTIDFSFKGAFVDVVDLASGSLPNPITYNDGSLPPSVLAVYSKFRNTVLPTYSLTVDVGNKVDLIEYVLDPTGYSHAVVTDHDPVVMYTPFIQLEATQNYYAELAGTANVAPGAFEAILGATGQQGNFFTISMPNAKIVKGLDVDSKNGMDSTNVTLRGYGATGMGATGIAGVNGSILSICQGNPTGMFGG